MSIEFPPHEMLGLDLKDPDIMSAYKNILNLILLGNRDQALSVQSFYESRWGMGRAMEVAEHATTDAWDILGIAVTDADEMQYIRPQFRGIGPYIVWPS